MRRCSKNKRILLWIRGHLIIKDTQSSHGSVPDSELPSNWDDLKKWIRRALEGTKTWKGS